jgi:anti-sigma factor RsiW
MTFNEIEILEYVENKLTEKRRIAFEQEIQNNPELKKLVKAMKASVLPYAAALSEQENDEMPQSITDFFDDVSRVVSDDDSGVDKKRSAPKVRRFRSVALAASFAMIFYLMGIISTMLFQPQQTNVQSSFVNYDVPAELFESMAIYQALYSRKTVEAAHQTMQDANSLVSEFNSQNEVETEIPDLSFQGYQFRRVQQLAFEGKPILQFVYLGKDGEPVAVCVTPAKFKGGKKSENYMATQFAGMNTVVWSHADSAYMLISKESKNMLNTLADSIRSDQT